MKLANLEDLFVEQMKDIHNAEKQLIKALPKMAKAASAPELKKAFQHHLEITEAQIARVEQIFEDMKMSPGRKKCVGMEGLIKEGDELMSEENIAPEVLDAGLIAAAQKVEHYEVATYGTLRTWAQQLGKSRAVTLLDQILKEEARSDEMLTKIAQSGVNQMAKA